MQAWYLKEYITGQTKASDFECRKLTLPELGDDEILVRNNIIGIDPYVRNMLAEGGYFPAVDKQKPVFGSTSGIVEQVGRKVSSIKVGQHVTCYGCWATHAIVNEKTATVIDVDSFPEEYYSSVLGFTGMTAWHGLKNIGEMQKGDTIFISAASGAVGTMAGQFAKKMGAKYVIGSTGSSQKVQWLKDEMGYDAVFNYKDGDVMKQLKAIAQLPQAGGIDVYFDNVGADHLEAALNNMNRLGRVILCGMIAQYENKDKDKGGNLTSLIQTIPRALTLRGLYFNSVPQIQEEFFKEVKPWVKNGEIKVHNTILNGFDKVPEAFTGLFAGKNKGKMLLKI